jgi:hypothetical protein
VHDGAAAEAMVSADPQSIREISIRMREGL